MRLAHAGEVRVSFPLMLVVCAWAADPPSITPTSSGDGFWRTELLVPAPIDVVRARLADPIATAKYSPDITSIQYVSQATCPTLRVVTEGMVDVAYDYKRCTTADGWHETLVSSDMLSVYEVRWRLASVEAGTQVSYDVKIRPNFPAPDFMLARQMKSSITTLLGRFYRAVTGE